MKYVLIDCLKDGDMFTEEFDRLIQYTLLLQMIGFW